MCSTVSNIYAMNSFSRCGKLCLTKFRFQIINQATKTQLPNLFFNRTCHDEKQSSHLSLFPVCSKILITNLPQCSRTDILELVQPYGKVVACQGPIERSGFMASDLPTQRYSAVHFTTSEEASKALLSLNGTVFKNRVLGVQLSDSNTYRLPGIPREKTEDLASFKPQNIDTSVDDADRQQQDFLPHEAAFFKRKPSGKSQIDDLLFMMNRYNSVSKYCLERCVQQLEKEGIQNVDDALLVLRCTGHILQNAKDKKSYTERVWKVFQDSGIPLTVAMFNTLMRVYIENEHRFDEEKLLFRMQSLGLKPDTDTYSLLVCSYCEVGDMDNVSKILKYMSSEEIPVDLNVFHFLLNGYFRAGVIDAALDLLDVMRANDVPPVLATYNILMNLFAETGDMNSVNWMMTEIDRQQMPIKSYALFNCIVSLVTNNHEEHVPEMLAKLESDEKYYKDAITCIRQLIQKGHVDMAYTIYLRFFEHEAQNLDGELQGRFILNALIANEYSFDVIKPIICDMDDRGSKRAISETTRLALLSENQDLALQCFDLMKERGYPIRDHMLWPLFIQYKNYNNFEGLVQLLRKREDLVPQSLQEPLNYYLYYYVLPVMEQKSMDRDQFLSTVQSEGLDIGEMNYAFTIYLAVNKSCQDALEFGENKELAVHPSLLKNLMYVTDMSKQWKSIIQVLHLCREKSENSDFGTMPAIILKKILQNTKNHTEVVNYFLSKKFKIGKMQMLDLKRNKLLDELPEYSVKQYSKDNMKDASVQQLEDHLKETPDDLVVKQMLMMKYCVLGDVDKVEKLKAELEDSNFKIVNAYPLQCLLFYNAHYKRDVDAALHYLNNIETDHPHYDDYLKSLLYTLEMLSEQGNVKEIIHHSSLYCKRHFHKVLTFRDNFGRRETMDSICSSIIKNLVEKVSLKEVLDVAFLFKSLFKTQKSVLEDLIQFCSDRDDTEALLETYQALAKKFQQNFNTVAVFIHLMNKEASSDEIQKVLEFANSVRKKDGDLNLLYSCIWCGKLQEAQAIIQESDLRFTKGLMMHSFEPFCDKLIDNQKISDLKELLKLAEQIDGYDKGIGFLKLVKGYVSIKDFENAKDTVSKMEEENLLTPNLMRVIHRLFSSHGINLNKSPSFRKNQGILSKPKEKQLKTKQARVFSKIELS